ncbi:MAG: MoxR family ATPase [Candidatus Staskawiczbacteria bacterium]|nr:MoxR family ATPase [Candidatus Staskawiczbacteria bacterium]
MPSPEQRASDPEPQLTQEEVVENIPNPEYPYIVIKEKSVSYLGVEVPKSEGGRLVPKESEFKEEYFYLEGHHETMREIATSLLLNKPILLEGGTGVYNKTTTVAKMCKDLNANYCKVNFDRETAREDVIGGQTLKVDENGKEKLEWYDGDLMYAIRNGGVAFLDEYNRQSKLAGIINPIIDAILNGRKEITNPYNENERVAVHPDFRLVAAQNPPGFEGGHEYTDRNQLPAETFGRWIYKKLPIEYTEEQENKLFAGMIGEDVELNIPESEFRHPGEGIPVKELAEVPGMVHWRREIITILRTLEAKSSGSKREMAKNQRQNLYFNPRLKKTIIDYIARFYNGDINETVKNGFETCIVGMYSSQEDKQKVRLLLDQASWTAPKVESKRRGLETRGIEAGKKRKLIDEIETLKSEIEDSGKLPETLKTSEADKEENPIIKGKTEKGEPVEFNFEQIKSKVVDFNRNQGLEELANVIESSSISLTKEQQKAIVEMVEKEGFDSAWIFPGNEMMRENSVKIKEGTEKDMEGLDPRNQYSEEGTYLYNEVSFEFPDKIQNNNRPDKPYVLLYKSNLETDEETRKSLKGLDDKEVDNSAENLRKYFEKRGIKGLTLEEYFVLQRVITENNKAEENPHPDTKNWTWLLDSELSPDSKNPGRVLRAHWNPGYRRVRVGSNTPGLSYPSVGARSSAIFEIL